jgi:hypothetical protein
VDPLSNEHLSRNPHSYGNSAGHLLLHLTGHLNYYIGAQIAATGYVVIVTVNSGKAARPAKDEVVCNFDRVSVGRGRYLPTVTGNLERRLFRRTQQGKRIGSPSS